MQLLAFVHLSIVASLQMSGGAKPSRVCEGGWSPNRRPVCSLPSHPPSSAGGLRPTRDSSRPHQVRWAHLGSSCSIPSPRTRVTCSFNLRSRARAQIFGRSLTAAQLLITPTTRRRLQSLGCLSSREPGSAWGDQPHQGKSSQRAPASKSPPGPQRAADPPRLTACYISGSFGMEALIMPEDLCC